MWFYGAYRWQEIENLITGTTNPDGSFPVDRTVLWFPSLKINYQLARNHQVSAFYQTQEKKRFNRGLSALRPEETTNDQRARPLSQLLSFRWDWTPAPNFLLNTRVNLVDGGFELAARPGVDTDNTPARMDLATERVEQRAAEPVRRRGRAPQLRRDVDLLRQQLARRPPRDQGRVRHPPGELFREPGRRRADDLSRRSPAAAQQRPRPGSHPVPVGGAEHLVPLAFGLRRGLVADGPPAAQPRAAMGLADQPPPREHGAPEPLLRHHRDPARHRQSGGVEHLRAAALGGLRHHRRRQDARQGVIQPLLLPDVDRQGTRLEPRRRPPVPLSVERHQRRSRTSPPTSSARCCRWPTHRSSR